MLRDVDYHACVTDLSEIVSSAFWRVDSPDADPVETREWLEAFDALVAAEGRERATFLLRKLLDRARARHVPLPPVLHTAYKNSIGLAQQPPFPGNPELEQSSSVAARSATSCTFSRIAPQAYMRAPSWRTG